MTGKSRDELRAQMLSRRNQTYDNVGRGWRDRRHRRPLVVAFFVLVAAAIVVGHLVYRRDLISLVWLGGMFVTTACWMTLRALTRGIAERESGDLDEHEQTLRDRVVWPSYRLTVGSSVLVIAYLAIFGSEPQLALRAIFLVLMLAWGCAALPTMLLAWQLPDDDPDDLDAEA